MTDINPKSSSTPNMSSETASKTVTEYKFKVLPENYKNFDLSFKLIVIGDSGVGKFCLNKNAMKNVFDKSKQQLASIFLIS